MKYYINNLLLYAIFGFIFETILKYTVYPNINNGSLFGPWIPIYGFGVCIIIFISKKIKLTKTFKLLLVFFISMFILTILEFIGGNLLELITNKVYWDYSHLKYHFGKYIALEISLIWGLLSIIVNYLIKPLTDKLIKKIPSTLTYLVFSIFILDFTVSFLKHII